MNYDHDYLGVGNSQHPANQPDAEPIEEEKELTIREALETGYEDKILEAIGRQEQKEAHVYAELIFIRDYIIQTETKAKQKTFLKNKINKLLKTLE